MLSRLCTALGERGRDLLAVAFPSSCGVCDRFVGDLLLAGVCLGCWARVEYLSGPTCPSCGRPHPAVEDDDLEGTPCGACAGTRPTFDAAASMGLYRGTLRALIHRLKFADQPELAVPLAARAHTYWRLRRGGPPDVDFLVPVPLPLARRLWRGYNQAAEVARAWGRLAGLPVATGALVRRGRARPQSGLTAAGRRLNVRGAFRLRRPDRLRGGSVLLVDDVWTTGATLVECARVLRRGGVRRVLAFSLARVPEDFDSAPSAGL